MINFPQPILSRRNFLSAASICTLSQLPLTKAIAKAVDDL